MTTRALRRAEGAAIQLPERTSSRAEATALVGDAIGTSRVDEVVVDASNMVLSAPSFLDQMVKEVLEVHAVPQLVVRSATARARRLLGAAADRRQVGGRISFEHTRT